MKNHSWIEIVSSIPANDSRKNQESSDRCCKIKNGIETHNRREEERKNIFGTQIIFIDWNCRE